MPHLIGETRVNMSKATNFIMLWRYFVGYGQCIVKNAYPYSTNVLELFNKIKKLQDFTWKYVRVGFFFFFFAPSRSISSYYKMMSSQNSSIAFCMEFTNCRNHRLQRWFNNGIITSCFAHMTSLLTVT